MPSQHPLAGVYAAAVTPLKADSTLDLDSVPALFRFLAGRGCHGAVLFGTDARPVTRQRVRLSAIQEARR